MNLGRTLHLRSWGANLRDVPFHWQSCTHIYVWHRCLHKSGQHSVESRALSKPSRSTENVSNSKDDRLDQVKDRQIRTPWHREGANVPPVRRQRSAGAMVKGKLLTTPSRLLKLVVPLSTSDHNADRKSVEPLALVVHPQQPLSYLERLIQSELPVIKTSNGDEKIPAVYFKAEDVSERGSHVKPQEESDQVLDRTKIDGKVEKTGIIKSGSQSAAPAVGVNSPGEKDCKASSGIESQEHSSPEDDSNTFVRWSSSTDIGDFIREATRGKEFIIEIEGLHKEIRIGVPSFNDRTYFLRQKLRRAATSINQYVTIKEECDKEAHKAAQRVAITGFGCLVLWWFGVYYLTFKTDLGWDFMEPITYLVGLSGLMMGYLWFLYHNREASYRAAMRLTISRRQSQLYAARGFNVERWEELVRDANALRAEIKAIASEYDVSWDEEADELDEKVTKVLEKDRKKKHSKSKEEDTDEHTDEHIDGEDEANIENESKEEEKASSDKKTT